MKKPHGWCLTCKHCYPGVGEIKESEGFHISSRYRRPCDMCIHIGNKANTDTGENCYWVWDKQIKSATGGLLGKDFRPVYKEDCPR
jgi:hypothetical protein